ncbi:putative aminohydrolase SsnA [uncultured Clostridium sp.]|uniref:putative aminohydrolase SsnA n=1 Tax=uncultured Clostridium sp. TaxID=59620 RepID=UPI0025F2C214|nr:putative aminohydrolase SsnA [uncultured Clostridium sp.]
MILVGNGKLITRDKNNPYYENGAVLLDKDKVKEVGNYKNLKNKYKDADFLDAKGMVIMPGLINSHQHIYSAFARGLNMPGETPKDFLSILEKTWWHIDRNLDLENTYYSAVSTFLECIRNGVTTVIDHHASFGEIENSLFEIARAAEELSVRTCLSYEISDRDGNEKMKSSVKENMDFVHFAKEKNNSMIKALVGMHASFTLSDETLNYCLEENNDKAGFHIHVAEGIYDAEHCRKNYNMSIVERLKKWDILGKNTIAAHCIHINEFDMDILKDTRTTVVHNPESNMGNAVGAPDVIKMLDKGILVGLGTDGYTNDMLESLKAANILQKHRRGSADRGFSESTELLFENNRKIASSIFKEDVGIIKPGAMADLIIVNYHPYTEMNTDNIDGHIMFGINGSMTDTTIINGEVLMRGRELCNIDEESLLNKCQLSANRLWSQL